MTKKIHIKFVPALEMKLLDMKSPYVLDSQLHRNMLVDKITAFEAQNSAFAKIFCSFLFLFFDERNFFLPTNSCILLYDSCAAVILLRKSRD